MLNAKIRGWGAYYQHGATRDSFHRIDHQIFLALWQWAKRRHSKKGKRWIKDRYWHNIRGNSWTFAAKFKKSNGKEDQLTLLKLASSFPFLQYTQIKGDMNPFDADCRLYFNKRMKSKMLVTLKGRKSLLYLWERKPEDSASFCILISGCSFSMFFAYSNRRPVIHSRNVILYVVLI